MIDRPLITGYKARGKVQYARHISPVGDLYLVGDSEALLFVAFACSPALPSGIEKRFSRGTPASIVSGLALIDALLATPHSREHPVWKELPESMALLSHHGAAVKLNLTGYTNREIAVYHELVRIPRGLTVSYAGLAVLAGMPGASRFVGNAMAKNRFPIIIPCHRVIRSNGTTGRYSGGDQIKERLLSFERT